MKALKSFTQGLALSVGSLLFAGSVVAALPTPVNSQITDAVTQVNANSIDDLRDVIVVGNNWDGTVDIYDPHTHERIKKLNAVPDKKSD